MCFPLDPSSFYTLTDILSDLITAFTMQIIAKQRKRISAQDLQPFIDQAVHGYGREDHVFYVYLFEISIHVIEDLGKTT